MAWQHHDSASAALSPTHRKVLEGMATQESLAMSDF